MECEKVSEAAKKGLLPVPVKVAYNWYTAGKFPDLVFRLPDYKRLFWDHREWELMVEEAKRNASSYVGYRDKEKYDIIEALTAANDKLKEQVRTLEAELDNPNNKVKNINYFQYLQQGIANNANN